MGRPANALALAAFLARQGKITEALDLCEKYASKLPPPQLALALVSVVQTGKPTRIELDRVEKKLKSLQSGASKDFALLFAEANLMHTLQRPAQSETIYRELLQMDANNAVVLNNLAWLISEQPESLGEAQQLINKAIELAGPEGALLDTRGMIFLRASKLNEAVNDLKLAVEKEPTPLHWLHLAYAQHQNKNTADAATAWNLAKKLSEGELSTDDKRQYAVLKLSYGN